MDFIVECMNDYKIEYEKLFYCGNHYRLKINNDGATVMFNNSEGVTFLGESLDYYFRPSLNKLVYEDDLPELTDDEYNEWYQSSILVDGVRMGIEIIKT